MCMKIIYLSIKIIIIVERYLYYERYIRIDIVYINSSYIFFILNLVGIICLLSGVSDGIVSIMYIFFF